MKKLFDTIAVTTIMLALGMATASCSSDDDNGQGLQIEPRYATITFENTDVAIAGPTPYGANLYSAYGDNQFTNGDITVDGDIKMKFGINESIWTNDIDFSAGGMVLSQWNYRTTPSSQTNPTWYREFMNQCSVYNTESIDGANRGAGADGSDTFAIIFGFDNQADGYVMGEGATISFTNSAELRVESAQVCLTTYVYANLAEYNVYGNHPTESMEQAKGWFKVLAYGYDADGVATNGGNPVEFYLCDYRETTSPKVNYVTKWTTWDLSALGPVNKIRFDFEGSDTGAWGLNTPAYACLDNISIKLDD